MPVIKDNYDLINEAFQKGETWIRSVQKYQ